LPKEKVQKDKQRSTKYTHKTKDRVTRIPLSMIGRCTVIENTNKNKFYKHR